MEKPVMLRRGRTVRFYRSVAVWTVGFWWAVFAVQAWRMGGGLLDDAFILFRYATHIGAGYGPVWNAGGQPTEGYTSFLYVLLMALPARLGWDLPACARLIGLLCAWGSIGLIYRCVEAMGHGARAAALGCGLFALNPFLIRHATTGMETHLYLLLTLGTFYFAIREPASPRDWSVAFGLGFLGALARPEGGLFVALLAATAWGMLTPEGRRPMLRAFVLGFVLPGVCYMGWRLWVFGHLFPNPFYVKQADGLLSKPGVAYVLRFLFPASFPFLLLALKRVAGETMRGRLTLPTGAASAACLGLLGFYCTVNPLMGGGFRFLVPLLPFLFVVGAPEVDATLNWGRHPFPAWLFPALLLGYVYLSYPTYLKDVVLGKEIPPDDLGVVEARLGRSLRPLRDKGTSIAWGDAGALAYYSGWRFLDLAGLNDNFIARSRGYPLQAVVRYIFDWSPALIVIPTGRGTGPNAPSVHRRGHGPHGSAVYLALLEAPQMAGYRYAGTFDTSVYNLNFFVRSDIPIAKALEETLQAAGGRILER